jgi:hypothetical protein
MAIVNARRDRRFGVQLSVAILSARGEVKGMTENASYRGVLIRTEQSPPARQLVRLRVSVPTHASALLMNGMVVHLAEVGGGVSEVGVSFYGLDGEPRNLWDKFIQSLQANERSSSADLTAAAAGAPALKPERLDELVVALASVDALTQLISSDVARGRLRIHPDATLRVGAALSIRLIHPGNQSSFLLTGHVRRRLDGGALSIQLAPMDHARQALLTEFANGNQEEDFEVVDLSSLRPAPRDMDSQAVG